MPIKEEIIAQIDRALKLYNEHRERAQYDDLSDLGKDTHEEVKAIVGGTIDRLAPQGSKYRTTLGMTLIRQIGSLKALPVTMMRATSRRFRGSFALSYSRTSLKWPSTFWKRATKIRLLF